MSVNNTFCGSTECGHPTTDNNLCHDCTSELVADLTKIPGLFDELRTTITRQTRFSSGGASIGKATETPVLFNTRAAQHQREITTTIRLWQGRLADHYGIPVRYPNPIAATIWLLTGIHTRGVAKFADAGHLHDQIHDAVTRTEKLIDKPADKWFAGICSALNTLGAVCHQDLYAASNDGTITCPHCATIHDVTRRRELLLKHAEDTLATATEAARAIVVWSDYERGENRLVKRIGMWADRKRIEKRGIAIVGGQERPTYRIGDILDLVANDTHGDAA